MFVFLYQNVFVFLYQIGRNPPALPGLKGGGIGKATVDHFGSNFLCWGRKEIGEFSLLKFSFEISDDRVMITLHLRKTFKHVYCVLCVLSLMRKC